MYRLFHFCILIFLALKLSGQSFELLGYNDPFSDGDGFEVALRQNIGEKWLRPYVQGGISNSNVEHGGDQFESYYFGVIGAGVFMELPLYELKPFAAFGTSNLIDLEDISQYSNVDVRVGLRFKSYLIEAYYRKPFEVSSSQVDFQSGIGLGFRF